MSEKPEPDFTLEEIIAGVQAQMPAEDDGAFCLSDLRKHTGLTENEASRLLRKLRNAGTIEPAGRVSRTDGWGDKRRVHAYRLVKQDEE